MVCRHGRHASSGSVLLSDLPGDQRPDHGICRGGRCGRLLFLHLCYRKLADARNAEVDEVMVDITDESYPLARELASFSRADYSHARRVMLVAARCCCGRGRRTCVQRRGDVLPYRRTGGRTACKNGVKMAQRACFPEKVIRIIGEYNGEETLPSTIESAIVHMVDGLLKNWRFWMRIPLAATGTRIW